MLPPRARARRALLGALAGFALLQAALLALVCRDPVLIREESWQRRVRCYRQRVAAEPHALTVVQLGSSRTANGLCGREGERRLAEGLARPVIFLNAGVLGGGCPLRMQIDLRRMLNDGVRPDLLLLELFPLGFDPRYQTHGVGPDLLPTASLRLSEARLLERLDGGRPGLVREWWGGQLVQLAARQDLLAGLIPRPLRPASTTQGPPLELDDWGHYAIDSLSAKEIAALVAQARAEYEGALATYETSPRAPARVGESIEAARKHGVAVALVVMPEGPAHRRMYPPGLWPNILAVFRDLAERHEVPLLDLRESMAEEDFIDSHHLYARGARRFTRELAGRIEPILRQIQHEKRQADR